MNEGDPAVDQIDAAAAAEQMQSAVEEMQASAEPQSFDEVSDEAALAGAPQLQLPTLTLPLAGMNLRVVRQEEGEVAMVVGPVLVNFVLPLDEDSAKAVAADLTGSGIVRADMGDLAKIARGS